MSVKDELHEIKKEAQAIKNKLRHSKNELNDIKKDTEAFKDESEKRKKVFNDESEKRKKVRINQIIIKLKKRAENANQLKVESKRLLEKLKDSTKISELQKLRDETKKYMDNAEK